MRHLRFRVSVCITGLVEVLNIAPGRVFALCDIKKHTYICEYAGKVMTLEEADKREATYALIRENKYYMHEVSHLSLRVQNFTLVFSSTPQLVGKTSSLMPPVQEGTVGRLINHAPPPHDMCGDLGMYYNQWSKRDLD